MLKNYRIHTLNYDKYDIVNSPLVKDITVLKVLQHDTLEAKTLTLRN